MTNAPVLTLRQLNRATLDRQLLLRRARLSVLDAVEHLVGLQAQAVTPPYEALAARLADFGPQALSEPLAARQVVRIPLMRSTIHLVSARDCVTLRPLVQPVLYRGFQGNQGKRLAGVDLARLAEASRELVEERPLTFKALGEALRPHWPDRAGGDLAMAARTVLPLVQVTPRGLWGRSGPIAHTTVEAWLGRPLEAEPDLSRMILRYLAAFGPASVRDLQTWCGLTGLREPVEALRPRLLSFRDEGGVELFDLPEAPRPDPDTPAPPRFLPQYDNVLLSHAERGRIVSAADRGRIWQVNQAYRTFLVDGFVRGTWRIESGSGTATLLVRPFSPLGRADRAALEDEARGVLSMAAPEAAHDLRYVSD
ncbi:winged helix DNA-binding domain-containing protein [Streptomyces palmae]|uniref:Winged helix DNA-binding domain-containing protein n=1 Tax=Streptomyces palmae TaxID=1701085 RepID=A0A4Z0HE92_9ACTN|nr:winged helix DNA-binding domain-containing protein [Streptomyces palmae]TGB12668.1 winged helix DNA-binding domain-containing protein [Streptomyces palmae]